MTDGIHTGTSTPAPHGHELCSAQEVTLGHRWVATHTVETTLPLGRRAGVQLLLLLENLRNLWCRLSSHESWHGCSCRIPHVVT